MTTRKKPHHPPEKTHFLWWCAAIICSILTLAVIIAGIVIFVGYIVIHPRIPIISVVNAHLNRFQFDMGGVLVTQVSIDVRSENDNSKAHASFSRLNLTLIFDDMEIAHLVAGPYEVRKNDSVVFNFLPTAGPIPLDMNQQRDVDVAINEDLIKFGLKGDAKARWRVGPLGSFGFQCHLDCQLKFHRSNGSYIPKRCTSKAK
ncbi:NDR1/HIN1-like protein 2 [Euphorbia lathyris]|uniref:NDR1/HIN1-like protein 2 n=1 Tax=Euphorbia lathyris TaxID=212925 RepID=UPI00331378A0